MEPSGERSVNPKVSMEYHNPENLEEFIKEFKVIYLEMDMTKKDAEEELKEKELHPLHGEVRQGSEESSSRIDRMRASFIGTCRSRCQPRGRRILFPPPRRMAIHGRVQEGTASIRISDQASIGIEEAQDI